MSEDLPAESVQRAQSRVGIEYAPHKRLGNLYVSDSPPPEGRGVYFGVAMTVPKDPLAR